MDFYNTYDVMDENEIIVIDTKSMEPPNAGSDLYISRKNFYDLNLDIDKPEVSIYVQAYNRLEKTRKCIEYILKNTKDINYELILVDNGSSDDTLKFFKSIKYTKKKIIHITKNVGASYPFSYILKTYSSNFLVGIANDVFVTKNWLSNMLKCMKSDDSIGMVCPMSTNVSNLQEPINIQYSSIDDFQKIAEKYNISDRSKWEQRMRLITIGVMFRREMIDLTGVSDYGFFHEFSEDDWCIRIRRAGYKLILCGDTIVYHDHDFRNIENKDQIEFERSLRIGRKNYKEKHYGLDAWDDVNNFERPLIGMLLNNINKAENNVIGIDVRMGTPILEVRNYLAKRGVENPYLNAYTTQAKYYLDLQTICNGTVYCDRMDYILDYYNSNTFDYVILGEPINLYKDPIRIIQKLIEITKMNGSLLIKLRNTFDFKSFLSNLGNDNYVDGDMPVVLSISDLTECLKIIGVKSVNITSINHDISSENIEILRDSVASTNLSNNIDSTMKNLVVFDYLLCIEK